MDSVNVPVLSTATLAFPQIVRYFRKINRDWGVAGSYWNIAHKAYNINPVVAIAQAVHETDGFWSDPATEWHNYCGLGVTDGDWRHGWAFPTIELGIHAHCAHLLAYTAAPHNATCKLADPRHFGHNGKIKTLADFNNCGWSANSSAYGDAIQTIYDSMAKA